jgi:glycine cleavage system H protein
MTRYTTDHEWIRIDGNVATVGISSYAQAQLGDVVFVDLPDIGKAIGKGAEAAVVESVKAASEVYAPIAGTVLEVNAELAANPALVNEDPESAGWFVKLHVPQGTSTDDLMDEGQYKTFVDTL